MPDMSKYDFAHGRDKSFISLSFSKNLIATLCGVVPFRGVVNYSADRSFGACFCRQCGGGVSDPILR